jgi:hypothetical protein
MSEYQYYEFQAIDRPLTAEQMEELRSFSSRARITSTTFVNECSYGSFKGDADAWMQDYFDAHLYLANWGTHVLMVALPARLLARAAAAPFCVGHSANVIERKVRVVLSFLSEDEDGDGWVDGAGQLSSIIGVRAELERGDLRALYLGWLLCAQNDELGDDDLEPPVPPGLGKLSASGESLLEFLRIDRDLLHVAAQASPDTAETAIELKDARKWLRSVVAEDKDDALARIIANDDAEAVRSLRKRLLAEQQGAGPSPGARRTVRELLDAANAWGRDRMKIEARRRAQKKAKEERAAAIAREAHLNSLAGREKELWREVDEIIPTKLPKNYDRAVQILCDLRDLDARKPSGDFSMRLQALRSSHSSKNSFLKRLNNGGL